MKSQVLFAYQNWKNEDSNKEEVGDIKRFSRKKAFTRAIG